MSRLPPNGLATLYERSRAGQGALLVLVGESGVGKTFEVQAFLNHNMTTQDLLLSAKCRPHTNIPFYPVYESVLEHATHHTKSKALRALLREYACLLPQLGSSLGALLQESYSSPLPTSSISSTFNNPHLLNFLRKLARRRLLVVWIDDFQWADADTILFAYYLQQRLSHDRTLWILSVNPRRQQAETKEILAELIEGMQRAASASTLVWELKPCTREDLLPLLCSILDSTVELDRASLDILYAKTRGVPYILRIFLDLMIDQKLLYLQNGSYRTAAPIRDLSLPEDLRGALASRLQKLYHRLPAARDVLEVASVIGERFAERTLETLLDICNVFILLSTIEEQHQIVRNLLRERQWEFEHVVIRDFVYDSLGAQAREFHLRLAQFLDATNSRDYDQIAYHFALAGWAEESVAFKLRHAETLLTEGSFPAALRAFGELRAYPGFTSTLVYQERAFDIEFEQALLLFYLGRYTASLAKLDYIRELLPNRSMEPELLLLRSRCLDKSNSASHFREARSLLERLRETLDKDPRRLLLARVCAEAVVCHAHLNNFAIARERFEDARSLLADYDEPLEKARLMRKAIMFYEPELTVPILRECLAIVRRYRIDHELIMTLNNLATEQMSLTQYDAASEALREAITYSVTLDNFRLDYLLCNRGLIQFRTGQPERALADFREALSVADRAVNKLIIKLNIGSTLFSLNEVRAAKDLFQDLLIEAQETGEDVYVISVKLNLARCHIVEGEMLQALLMLASSNVPRIKIYSERRVRDHAALLDHILYSIGSLRGSSRDKAREQEAWKMPYLMGMEFWGD
jgi:tetratricopeptide (TPR) repeat protein